MHIIGINLCLMISKALHYLFPISGIAFLKMADSAYNYWQLP